MIRKSWLALVVLTLTTLPCLAGRTQDAVRSRWLGAWVVVRSEVSSDCSGLHTNNKVHGQLSLGTGFRSFAPGELGQVTGVDLKRSRVDVFVALREDVLIRYEEGPFELFREAGCRIEMLVDLPRAMVKEEDIPGIEDRILQVLERHVTLAEAEGSELWNEREREPYPSDYDRTLAEHAVWKAETHNRTVDGRIQDSMRSAEIVLERVSVERDGYSEAFASGVEDMSDRRFDRCETVLKGSYDSWKKKPPEGTHEDGYYDGQLLAYSIQVANHLKACYVPVPEPPPALSDDASVAELQAGTP